MVAGTRSKFAALESSNTEDCSLKLNNAISIAVKRSSFSKGFTRYPFGVTSLAFATVALSELAEIKMNGIFLFSLIYPPNSMPVSLPDNKMSISTRCIFFWFKIYTAAL
jgi:hypothetical protein